MSVEEYNRRAWDAQVDQGNRWTTPVSEAAIAAARAGEWEIVLTPQRPVPRPWFPPLPGLDMLCLASGGGQQAAILAAAGARVTSLDNSPRQLEQDQIVARRDGLRIVSVRGDIRDLSSFAAESFDVVFNPCSVCFIPDVHKVFLEAQRVLRPGGLLMCGFVQPVNFIFDETESNAGRLVVRHALPYSDESRLTPPELERLKSANEPLMFSHSLTQLIGGQLTAGFELRDLFEDTEPATPLSQFLSTYFATLSEKPAGARRAASTVGTR